MTEARALELVMAQFATQWAAASGNVPFDLENEQLPSSDFFALCTVRHSGSIPYTSGPVGKRRKEIRGNIFVKLWGPADQGRNGTSVLADAARVVFEGQQLGTASEEPITILTGQTQEIGVDGRWYMSSVVFPFRYYGTY